MDFAQKFNRYIHCHNVELFFIDGNPKKALPEAFDDVETLKALSLATDIRKSLEHAKTAVQAGTLHRPEELVRLLVALVLSRTDDEERAQVYAALPDILATFYELSLFVKLYREKKKSLGRGMQGVVLHWYAKQSSPQLASMLSEHISLNGYSHKDIINLVHLKVEDGSALRVIYDSNYRYKPSEDELKQPELKKMKLICELKVSF